MNILNNFNNKLANVLADILSNMYFFWFCVCLDLYGLVAQPPQTTLGWCNYISQTCIQLLALSVLAFVSKISSERQEKVIRETHNMIIEQLRINKDEIKNIVSIDLELDDIRAKLDKIYNDMTKEF